MQGVGDTKTVRSYRLVFRRRWRIFRIGNWRLPLPGGLELRLIGYWLACLATSAILARLPLLGPPVAAMPPALRLLAIPLLAAWVLCRWEIDGRPPHRALLGLAGLWLRPRVLAAGRRVPRSETSSRRSTAWSSRPTSNHPGCQPAGSMDRPVSSCATRSAADVEADRQGRPPIGPGTTYGACP